MFESKTYDPKASPRQHDTPSRGQEWTVPRPHLAVLELSDVTHADFRTALGSGTLTDLDVGDLETTSDDLSLQKRKGASDRALTFG